MLVVGKDNSILIKSNPDISIQTQDWSNPGTAPHVEVQKWPPTVNDDWENDNSEDDISEDEDNWQHQELLRQEVKDDTSSDDNWQHQELLRQEVKDDAWSIDLSKSHEQSGASILDMWHKQQQQQQVQQQQQAQLQQQQQQPNT